MKKIRLSEKEKEIIKRGAEEIFGKGTKVYLLGAEPILQKEEEI